MFFIFKTKHCLGPSLIDLQSNGSFFIHDTGALENKVCMFGKVMAIIAIGLGFLRVFFINEKIYVFWGTIVFNIICITLAAFLNLNALMYILPLIVVESFILQGLV